MKTLKSDRKMSIENLQRKDILYGLVKKFIRFKIENRASLSMIEKKQIARCSK